MDWEIINCLYHDTSVFVGAAFSPVAVQREWIRLADINEENFMPDSIPKLCKYDKQSTGQTASKFIPRWSDGLCLETLRTSELSMRE